MAIECWLGHGTKCETWWCLMSEVVSGLDTTKTVRLNVSDGYDLDAWDTAQSVMLYPVGAS